MDIVDLIVVGTLRVPSSYLVDGGRHTECAYYFADRRRSGLKTPPTRGYILKLTHKGRVCETQQTEFSYNTQKKTILNIYYFLILRRVFKLKLTLALSFVKGHKKVMQGHDFLGCYKPAWLWAGSRWSCKVT